MLSADLVLKVREPVPEEVAKMSDGAKLVSFIWPANNTELVKSLADKKMTVWAMDCIPRLLSRGQTYDALSSQAGITGYRAVIEASNEYGSYFAGATTAAGKVAPAKVLVIGGGVAGLAAVQTAKNLGAIARCFDVRPAVKEQVESLGASYLEVEMEESGAGGGGYAKEMSEDFNKAQMALFKEQAKEIDIVISTALIPFRPAPKLWLAEAVAEMKPGSVVVDLAAERGGNCDLTKADQKVVTDNGVSILGYTDLISRLPTTSSTLYANNITKFVLHAGPMTGNDESSLTIDHDDPAVRQMLVLQNGESMHPPPEFVPPAATGPAAKTPEEIQEEADAAELVRLNAPAKAARSGATTATATFATLCGLGVAAPDGAFTGMCTTFALAGLVGQSVVWGVAHSLHSPLMAVTNAISGITAVGGLQLMGSSDPMAVGLGCLSTGISSVNITGGFLVTKRMLDMFRRADEPPSAMHYYAVPAAAFAGMYGMGVNAGYEHIHSMAYLGSGLCCIGGIGGLASQASAPAGLALGQIGVGMGLVTTLAMADVSAATYSFMAGTMAVGGAAGLGIGRAVEPTTLPQTVAAFHSLVGAAATATCVAQFYHEYAVDPAHLDGVHRAAIYFGTFIGSVTLTGSIIAFGKLHGLNGKLFDSAALELPGKHVINSAMAAACLAGLGTFLTNPDFDTGVQMLALATVVPGLLGVHMAASVGGADMPVVITLLNSYSGWALCAEGFMLNNDLLTVVGSLIGCSGAILSYIMCVAMNRSLPNVILGGLTGGGGEALKYTGTHTETSVDQVGDWMCEADHITIVPGYGLAVAQGQFAVADFCKDLTAKGTTIEFGIHDVAGRMPGQLNVLLADAGVDYDIVHEKEHVNSTMKDSDLCLVIGANDTINRAALEDPNCAIAGMPVIEVWNAKQVVVFKRSMGVGYAGVDNPVFFDTQTAMLLGDAKVSCTGLSEHVKKTIG